MEFISKESTVLTKKPNKVLHPLKKMMVTAIAASALVFGSGQAIGSANSLTTVYYVYLNDTYIGTVSDKSVVESIIDRELQEMKQANKGIDFKLGSKLTYISEQVFRSTANNQKAAEKLAEEITLEVESAAIVIDGQPVVQLGSKEAAEETLKKLKLKYVTEEQLKEFEARKEHPSTALPALKENETRILDVRLTNEAEVKETTTEPQNILTPDEAVNFLLKGTLEEQKYTVKDGDVLGSIAVGANLSTSELLALNPGMKEDSLLKIGQELNITVPKPYLEIIVDKEMFKKETVSFQTEVEDNASMFKGDKKVKQEGKNGEREVTYAVSEKNGKVIKNAVVKEQVTQKPVNHIIVRGTKVVPSRGEGSFAWPASGGYVSSQVGHRWGKMHKGIDIARPSNLTIKAADNGTVVSAGWDGGYGNKIVIDHQNGFRTVYAHLSSIDVRAGQTVAKGSKIGNMGSTGNSTGVHLHFEVYKNGSLQNPMKYLRK
ncbi:M23 family peptidase [Neobacillus notoginsengisoli]|uniref:M23 family peptidase n=1 Tax=Neobacillus notoginsengisoli TaxID=1578198 RepID=A0A417YTQ1_9BACI|nr:M23 family metallopeptidase [Neobacillus notoginsengisoli]RHW40410.1 M23 family peptidase [Neobacillus notoginsengisoli]